MGFPTETLLLAYVDKQTGMLSVHNWQDMSVADQLVKKGILVQLSKWESKRKGSNRCSAIYKLVSVA